MRSTQLSLAATILTAVVLAGCGSGNSSSGAASPPPAKSTSSTPAASNATPSTAATVALTTKRNAKLGTILAAGPKRLTVYLFEGDRAGASSCTGPCASAWPPVKGKAQVAGGAIAADLGTITRSDGTTQVTYKGHPIYFFVKDGDSGDAYGEGLKAFGADWYVLAPSGDKVDHS